MGDDSTSFLDLFKHKSAIDPRLARSSSMGASNEGSSSSDSDDTGDTGNDTSWRTQSRSRTKRKPTQHANGNVKRSKSDLQKGTTSKSNKSGTQQQPFTLDDDNTEENGSPSSATYTSTSEPTYPLPSYLANALQRVNENKKLRAQLHSSVDSTADMNLPPPQTNRHAGSSTNKPAPTVYNIDSDDENDTNGTKTPTKNTSTNRTSTHTNSTSNSATNSSTTSVLLSVYYSESDSQPLKFRYLRTEAFIKLFNTFCKFKEIDGSSAGIKWYGISLDLNQTPLDYEMTDEENLYYYDKNRLTDVGNSNTNNTNKEDPSDNITSAEPAPENIPSDVIVVRLREGPHVQRFRIRMSDTFKKLADGFAAKHNIDPSKVTLVFDGLALAVTATPETQDMETDDIIDVKISK